MNGQGEKIEEMGISVARLRMGLVVGVVLLAVVVGGFLGYARYRAHRFLAGLPGRLGVDIRRETNGYTVSQSVGGKTVMTMHAAKAVEHTDGKITLHDVRMILYGRKQDRADQISGSEFEYDQATGVVRAVGEVHIDLEAPSPASQEGLGGAAAVPMKAEHVGEAQDEGKRIIHVKTSGLVYLQKLGVAATDQPLEFQFHGLTGHAVGAEYNSDTGIVILQSAVKANGLEHGTPVVLTATHAELNRPEQRAVLTEARYVSPGQMVRGDRAVVHLRADGSPERIEADGNVALEKPGAGRMTAPQADLLLNPAGQAQDAHFFGGVGYVNLTTLREERGEAHDARVNFNATGQAQSVALAGAVHLSERVRSAGWSTRDAVAGAMTFALVAEGKRQILHEAEAIVGARVLLVSDVGTAREARSELAGDRLRGEFTDADKSVQLTKVQGAGHTLLRRNGPMGAEQTSVGDMLEVMLRPAGVRGSAGAEQVARAMQTGHVALTSRAATKLGISVSAPVERASAETAVYDGDVDHLTLTGHARMVDPQVTVAAERIVLENGSGDATATGTVKATYVQAAAIDRTAEPVHVLADRAELQHDAQRAIFHGAAGGPLARLWQGGSQVEAPVIDLEQAAGRLTARAEAGGTAADPVHAVLVGPSVSNGKKGQDASSVVRVASRTMVYLDAQRQVHFGGGVNVENAEGTMRAEQAVAYLQAAAGPDGATSKSVDGLSKQPDIFFGGSVDHIVATGKIEMEQPGRRGIGERLVYTANDGLLVLTGTAGTPPRLMDSVEGTVTGQELRFHSGDRSVEVLGRGAGQTGVPAQRVHTVTRVKQP